MTDSYLDGNVLAGPLSELFTVDVTEVMSQCVSCGQTGPMAQLRVYTQAPGMVARCPGCEEVVMRLVTGPSSTWLDLRGATNLRFLTAPDWDG